MSASSRDHQHNKATTVRCVECDVSSSQNWQGWRAYRVDEPGTDESPALAFYCPQCASHQFGGRMREGHTP